VLHAGLGLLAAEGLDALTARRLAREAATSPAAVYELFGDKAGVVRAIFFRGFRALADELAAPVAPARPPAELLELAQRYRGFILAHPALAAVMFSRPYASFDPAPEERAAGAAVRERILAAVSAAIEAGALAGDALDIAHAYVALIHGFAAAEVSQRLGRSERSVQRRWDGGVQALLAGFAPAAPATVPSARAPADIGRARRAVPAGARAASIRRGTASDAGAIGRLLHEFNVEFDEPTPGPARLAGRIERMLGEGDTSVLLAGASADGLAVLRFRASIWTEGLECYLAELYVVPSLRGRGIGRALMVAAMAHARERGADHIDLGTAESDLAARGLYESLGFSNREGRPGGPLNYFYEREL